MVHFDPLPVGVDRADKFRSGDVGHYTNLEIDVDSESDSILVRYEGSGAATLTKAGCTSADVFV